MGPNRVDPSPAKHPRRRAERAATLVEYALLVAVLAIPTISGLSYLTSGTKTKMTNVADNVAASRSSDDDEDPGDDGGGSGGSSTTTTTTSTTTSTTTTTIATTTTTTTQKPTTTTTTTTTTIPQTTTTLPRATNAPATATATKTSSKSWSATASTTVTTSDGSPVVGARVTLEICTRQGSSGAWDCTSYQVTTDRNGNASKTETGFNKSDTMMRATVLAVVSDNHNITVDSSSDTANSPFCSKKC